MFSLAVSDYCVTKEISFHMVSVSLYYVHYILSLYTLINSIDRALLELLSCRFLFSSMRYEVLLN
jgi:hypothetical protein